MNLWPWRVWYELGLWRGVSVYIYLHALVSLCVCVFYMFYEKKLHSHYVVSFRCSLLSNCQANCFKVGAGAYCPKDTKRAVELFEGSARASCSLGLWGLAVCQVR
jgi:hypothetical protein